MKKWITLTMAIFIFQMANAQDSNDAIFKKFKVDVSLGYVVPQGSGRKGGALLAIEPKYAVMDELSLGLRIEGAGMANSDEFGDVQTVKANVSYLATGDYYFSNNRFRPFLGAGAGIFTFASVDVSQVDPNFNDIPVNSKFGFMTRGGFEYGHLRVGVEYNFVSNQMGYLGLKIGGVIGGGRK